MIFVVLPAYNEQKSIPLLFERIGSTFRKFPHDYRIILVDDGSRDDTLKMATLLKETMPVETLVHPVNKGLGEALKTGLVYATNLAGNSDVIITMDTDNTHDPDLMPQMHRKILEGCDMVIASRYVKNGRVIGVPHLRRFLGRAASLLFRIFFPITGVRDYTCGYRAYRATLLKKAFQEYDNIFISQSGFSCQVDILLKLRRFIKPFVCEVPIVLKYDERRGLSKMKVGKTIRETLLLFFHQLFTT